MSYPLLLTHVIYLAYQYGSVNPSVYALFFNKPKTIGLKTPIIPLNR
jgi:hypothetical protein